MVTERTKVLVVDDSSVVRRMLTDILQSDGDIEVVAVAATAAIARRKIPLLSPDVVLLDIEMPEMDGIEAARHVRRQWPTLPILMCSSLTEAGAEATLRALASCASDCIAKPSGGTGSLSEFRAELLAKVRGLGARRAPAAPAILRRAALRTAPQRSSARVSVVAVGASTGGPVALTTLFDAFPADLGVPVVVVQHMPPLFTKALADRPSRTSRVRVTEAAHGELLEPGRAYVAPGAFHLRVEPDRARVIAVLDQGDLENSCRPAVDVLFRSVARVFGAGVLGVVLTGMGRDGARGADEIVRAGGSVIVQDSASSVVAGMPEAVAELGIADGAYAIERIGAEITNRVRSR